MQFDESKIIYGVRVVSKRISFFSNLIYFVVVALFVVLRIMSNFNLFDFMGGGASFIIGLLTQAGLLLALPFLMFKYLTKFSVKETFNFFGYKKVSYKTVLVSIALGVVVFFLNVYVSSFFNSLIEFFGYHPSSSGEQITSWGTFFLSVFSTAILPAICEESLHRGLYIKGVSDRGILRSILLSGLLFGLLHMNIEQFFYATLIGFFLGYLSWGCNSIYPCMIVHFMNNFLSVLFAFARSQSWAFGNFFSNLAQIFTSNHFFGILFFVLLLILLVVIAKELTNFLVKDAFNYNIARKQKQLANMAIRDNYFKQIEELKKDQTSKPLYSTENNTIYIDFREFMEYVANNMEQIDHNQQPTKPIKNIELKTKILLWGSIILSATITILSFIWGLFR